MSHRACAFPQGADGEAARSRRWGSNNDESFPETEQISSGEL